MNKKPKRNSGGILILIKKDIDSFITVVQHSNEDIISLKLDKQLTNYDFDVYICCAYLSSKSSCRLRGDDTSKLSTIHDDEFLYREKGKVVIMGDLNCRVGTQADFIDMAKSDEYLNLPDAMENISIDDIIEENSNI